MIQEGYTCYENLIKLYRICIRKCELQIYCLMMKMGIDKRRKSYANAQICLPRKSYSRGTGIRTIYQQMPPLSQQLKSFRRKLLFESIPSVQTLPQIRKNQAKEFKQIKTQKSLANSQSNLIKNNQTLMTMGSEADIKINKSIYLCKQNGRQSQQSAPQTKTNQEKNQEVKLNMDLQNNVNKQEQEQRQEHEEQEDPEDQKIQKQNNQLLGYTMGNQIEAQEDSQDVDKYIPKMKSFSNSQNHKVGNKFPFFIPENQEQAMMEAKYLEAKYRLIKQRRQDIELLHLVNSYKSHKERILKQSSRKHQSVRVLGLIRKASSLPKLTPNISQTNQGKYVIIPSYQQLRKNPQVEQSSRDILSRRLGPSMSYGKIQLLDNSKKNKEKDINHQVFIEQELNQLITAQKILRQKGIKISLATLKNGLVSTRNAEFKLQDDKVFQSSRLISNPYQIKQKVKLKR